MDEADDDDEAYVHEDVDVDANDEEHDDQEEDLQDG